MSDSRSVSLPRPPALALLPTDTRFREHCEEGDPRCYCSRCWIPIGEDEVALRFWPESGLYEYRFCEECQKGMELVTCQSQ